MRARYSYRYIVQIQVNIQVPGGTVRARYSYRSIVQIQVQILLLLPLVESEKRILPYLREL